MKEETKKKRLFNELLLMVDVFNSCVVTGVLPKAGSQCNQKILELLEKGGKVPTASPNERNKPS